MTETAYENVTVVFKCDLYIPDDKQDFYWLDICKDEVYLRQNQNDSSENRINDEKITGEDAKYNFYLEKAISKLGDDLYKKCFQKILFQKKELDLHYNKKNETA